MSETPLTRQQRAVADALADHGRFISAQDLHRQITEAGGQIGLATVYRACQALAGSGVADVLLAPDGVTSYRICSPEHHHHLVCRVCGAAVEIEGPPEGWVSRVALEHGYVGVEHTIELVGLCPRCA